MTRNQIIANTLRWCNAQRKKKGLEPLVKLPKGERINRRSCPCGTATGLSVGYIEAHDPSSARSILLPQSVTLFTQLFDRGDIPEYDEAVA